MNIFIRWLFMFFYTKSCCLTAIKELGKLGCLCTRDIWINDTGLGVLPKLR
jgi:hypothetical protein